MARIRRSGAGRAGPGPGAALGPVRLQVRAPGAAPGPADPQAGVRALAGSLSGA